MSTFATLIADARKQVGATASNWSDADIWIDINNGQDEVASIIQRADGAWQWEDRNITTSPMGRTNITLGEQSIGIDQTFLKIEKVWIHLSATDLTWNELPYNEDKTHFLSRNPTHDVGVPTQYTLIGNEIFFNCFPNYTTLGDNSHLDSYGVRVLFSRTGKYVGDGTNGTLAVTETPGFNPQHHKYLSLYAQRERLESKEKGVSHYNKVVGRMLKMEKDIQTFYANRKKGSNQTIGKASINIQDYI